MLSSTFFPRSPKLLMMRFVVTASLNLPTNAAAAPEAPLPTAPAAPQPQAVPQGAPQQLQVKLVDRTVFCSRLAQQFAAYGATAGYSKVETALLASSGTEGIIEEFRAGRTSDYINTAALAKLARVPVKSGVPAADAEGWLPISRFLGDAMSVNGDVIMALSTGELRFVPLAQRGANLILVAANASALTPTRMRQVAEAARKLEIKVHVVWVGPTDASGRDLQEAAPLVWIAAMTGGSVANLGGSQAPCDSAT